MSLTVRALPAGRAVFLLAALTFAAGVAGMVLSYQYLASDHPLDVQAGAAGFVAENRLGGRSRVRDSGAISRPHRHAHLLAQPRGRTEQLDGERHQALR